MESTGRIIIIIKYLVLYWTPDFLGMILCLGKNALATSNGLGKKIQLTLEQYMFELRGSTYTWIFFSINIQSTLYSWVSHPRIQPTAAN